jgi:hypothetical protein
VAVEPGSDRLLDSFLAGSAVVGMTGVVAVCIDFGGKVELSVPLDTVPFGIEIGFCDTPDGCRTIVAAIGDDTWPAARGLNGMPVSIVSMRSPVGGVVVGLTSVPGTDILDTRLVLGEGIVEDIIGPMIDCGREEEVSDHRLVFIAAGREVVAIVLVLEARAADVAAHALGSGTLLGVPAWSIGVGCTLATG